MGIVVFAVVAVVFLAVIMWSRGTAARRGIPNSGDPSYMGFTDGGSYGGDGSDSNCDSSSGSSDSGCDSGGGSDGGGGGGGD